MVRITPEGHYFCDNLLSSTTKFCKITYWLRMITTLYAYDIRKTIWIFTFNSKINEKFTSYFSFFVG